MINKTPTNWSLRDNTMLEEAIRRGASRRDLLKMLMASGVGIAAGGSLLASAGAAVAQTPKSGGDLVVAGWSASTADTLDPAKASLSTDYARCCAFYNRLTFMNEAGEIEMELADTLESDDAKTWQIKLKPDVTFHNGKTLDSADVVYSLKRHMDDSVGSKARSMAEQMVEISAVDDRTVKIVLSSANADLPTILALHHFMIIADGTTDFSTANGTGAFTCEEFEPGVRSIGLKNPNYFKPEGPYVESFEFFAIPDNNARVNALLSGDIQLAGAINARSVRKLENQPSVTTAISQPSNYTNLNIRLDMDPGAKAGFIEGMKHLVNRELILQSVLRDFGEIGFDQPIPSANPYHNPNLTPKEFDPERARSLFKKAGLLDQTIPVIASSAATSSIDMATIIQQEASGIGLELDVQRVPADGYWSNYWLESPVHFGNINPRPTPDTYFSLLYASDAPWNESRYESEKFDSMMIEARGLLDEEKRTEIYWEMQEMIANDAGTIIPAFMSVIDGQSNKLKGMRQNPLGNMMGFAFAEHVWLED